MSEYVKGVGWVKLDLDFSYLLRESCFLCHPDQNLLIDHDNALVGLANNIGKKVIVCDVYAGAPGYFTTTWPVSKTIYSRSMSANAKDSGYIVSELPLFDRPLKMNYTINLSYGKCGICEGGRGEVSIHLQYPSGTFVGESTGQSFFWNGFSNKTNIDLSDTIRSYDTLRTYPLDPSYPGRRQRDLSNVSWWYVGPKSFVTKPIISNTNSKFGGTSAYFK